jgi:hypothetical protein
VDLDLRTVLLTTLSPLLADIPNLQTEESIEIDDESPSSHDEFNSQEE